MDITLRILMGFLSGFLLILACEREAWAYTDPGSGALLWQMVGAAFFGAAFYFRKLIFWLLKQRRGNRD